MDLSQLNMPQREAVECTEGPLLILAGAGSGKTRVLTTRIAYLIYEKQIEPWNILAITFTNKAAQEMRERIVALVGQAGEKVWASTFHYLCVRILRKNINRIGQYDNNFVIYDASDQQALIKRILKEKNLEEKDYKAKTIISRISDYKNKMISPKMAINQEEEYSRKKVYAEIYEMYQERLQKNNALDFDDLLILTLELFKTCSDILEHYQDKFQYILVDEYQDTNIIQYELIKLLANKYQNLCVVGDDDQSIYHWRGADIRNILNFELDYPSATIIKLEENYRSTQVILDAAYHVIKHNHDRKDKRLWTEKKDGELLSLFVAYDQDEEASYILKQINAGLKMGYKYKDFAILCRTTAQHTVIRDYLNRGAIPHRIYGGRKLEDHKEVKDLMAYLKFVVNPADEISAEHAFFTKKRGVGETSWRKLLQFGHDNNITVLEAMIRAEESALSKKYALVFAQFGNLINTFRTINENVSATEITKIVLEESGYLQELEAENTEESNNRIDNLKEFISMTVAFDEKYDAMPDGLSVFLAERALVTSMDEVGDDANTVSLMTIHSAKGLEFPIVFLAGMEEGLFPTISAINAQSEFEMDEERRLCYVALTRAKEKVYLIYTKSRLLYGQRNKSLESRFIKMIPEELIDTPAMYKRKQSEPQRDSQNTGLPLSSLSLGITQTKAKEDTPISIDYQVNDIVEHKKWGQGVVASVSGSGDELSIRVIFPDKGMKDLIVKYAPIKKV